MEKNMCSKITYEQIRTNEEINILIEQGNAVLGALGYTEHSKKHAAKVAKQAGDILEGIGCNAEKIELAKIAGYMHDIGNTVNRNDHAHTGAIMAYQILKELGMPLKDAAVITSAIGNHDEKTGTAIDEVSAALILADKTDVRRNRVRTSPVSKFDIHDRVNYAVLSAELVVDKEQRVMQMIMELDDSICSVMDYFEIFLQRMVMCQRAASVLGYKFQLIANGSKLC